METRGRNYTSDFVDLCSNGRKENLNTSKCKNELAGLENVATQVETKK